MWTEQTCRVGHKPILNTERLPNSQRKCKHEHWLESHRLVLRAENQEVETSNMTRTIAKQKHATTNTACRVCHSPSVTHLCENSASNDKYHRRASKLRNSENICPLYFEGQTLTHHRWVIHLALPTPSSSSPLSFRMRLEACSTCHAPATAKQTTSYVIHSPEHSPPSI